MGPGARLPSERELAARYDVARMTVRGELRRLEADGIVVIRPGAGVFVAEEPRPPRAVGSSFSRDMAARGLVPGGIVIEHSVLTATRRLALRLDVPEGSKALRVVRIRTADGEPLAVERTTLSLLRFPGLEDVDLNNASLYEVLRDRWDAQPRTVSARASASLPTPEEAELLEIEPSAPCMVVTSLQRSDNGMPIEAGRSIYRGDRYDLDISYQLAT